VSVSAKFERAGTIEELKSKRRLILRGAHRPILVVEDQGRIFALDNRCPHMGFPLDRGSIEDGILTCHWHHARFDLASGCTFDSGRMTYRRAKSNCAGTKFGSRPISGIQMPRRTGSGDSNRAWRIISGSSLPRPYRVN
jgi:nitrite reductase/ring-hydroxylating ferredoxin subunit